MFLSFPLFPFHFLFPIHRHRSSLYVRIQPNPSVDLLSSSFLTLTPPIVTSNITAMATATADLNVMTTSTPIKTTEASRTIETNTNIATPLIDDVTNNKDKDKDNTNKFIVLKLRNSSRQLAVVSTCHEAARNVLVNHIMRSRDRNVNHPLHAFSSSNSNYNYNPMESDPESFSEFLEPENTKNFIIPRNIWEKRNSKNLATSSGLYWALYDSFSSSIVPIFCNSNSNITNNNNNKNEIQGSIRRGAVLGLDAPKGLNLSPRILTPILPGSLPLDHGSKIDKNMNLKASVLLFQKNILVFENTYTVNTKNNFKCVLWEEYDLHLKILCSNVNGLSVANSDISPQSSSTSRPAESTTNNIVRSSHSKAQQQHQQQQQQGAQYEVSLLIRLIPEKHSLINDIKNKNEIKNENEVLINGKTKFYVYGGLVHGNSNGTTTDVVTSIEKLQICFPLSGIFSIQIMYRDLNLKNSEDDKLYPISTVFVQVQ